MNEANRRGRAGGGPAERAGRHDQLFLALLNQARAGRFSRQMGQRLDSLAALARAARIRPDERLRDEAIAAMALPDVRRVRCRLALLAPRHRRGGVTAGSTGSTPARTPGGSSASAASPTTRRVRRIASGPISGNTCSSAPTTGSCLAASKGCDPHVWRVADGQPVLRDEPRGCRGHAFSPDGRSLAVGQEEWVLCFDLATGRK